MRLGRLLLMIAPLIALTGCEAHNLYVAHETVIGVNASLNQDRQQGRLVIGYDRDFITIIPKAVAVRQDDRTIPNTEVVLLDSNQNPSGIVIPNAVAVWTTDQQESGGTIIPNAVAVWVDDNGNPTTTKVPFAVPIRLEVDPILKDVMALINCTHLEVKGVYLTKYADSLATGEAAKEIGRKLGKKGKADTAKFFNCADGGAP